VQALFSGLKPAVIAIVVQAVAAYGWLRRGEMQEGPGIADEDRAAAVRPGCQR
jgi:hypothetical protein